MKVNKIYKFIFDNIIKSKNNLNQIELDDGCVCIAPDGYFGFVFSKNNLPFNLELIRKSIVKLDLNSVVKPENLCKPTNVLIIDKHFGFLKVFKIGDRKSYVNSKYLQYFEDYTEFYQEKDLSIMVAVEYGQVVGCIMPVRYMKGEDDE